MKETIDVLVARYTDAFNRRDAEAFTSLFAEEAQLMAPHVPTISGREAIRDAMPGFWEFGLRDLELTPLTVRRHGDIVLDSGRWSIRIGSGPDAARDEGKDIRVWQRQADGSWKIIFDIWNTDLPALGQTSVHVAPASGR